MPDEPELDDIDKFLSTLHIPDEMIDDPDRPRPVPKPRQQLSLQSMFPITAWAIFIISLLTILRASPSGSSFFHSMLSITMVRVWNTQLLFSAMCYLFANCVVSAGGIAIYRLKHVKMKCAGVVNLWIMGVSSLITAIVLLFII